MHNCNSDLILRLKILKSAKNIGFLFCVFVRLMLKSVPGELTYLVKKYIFCSIIQLMLICVVQRGLLL